MYSEGEVRYLKDLDWVNIVKSIRELKALTRILLNQNQREILAFERESVLPSSKVLDKQEEEFLQNHVPFEYANMMKQEEYLERVNLLVDTFEHKRLSNLDTKIIEEISNEPLEATNDKPPQKKEKYFMEKSKQQESKVEMINLDIMLYKI